MREALPTQPFSRRWTPASIAVTLTLLLALAAVLWWWLDRPQAMPALSPEAVVQPPVLGAAPEPAAGAELSPPAAPASAASMPEPAASTAALPPLPTDEASLQQALAALVGRELVLKFIQTDRFAQRVVATVDNLPRQHAAPRLWPLNPSAGRFTVEPGKDGRQQISSINNDRYATLLQLLGRLPAAEAAAFYRRLQPQLQSAYEELGYPGQSFQARLLEVLDHLLATPELSGPLAVSLTEVKGPIASERPWVRYEFVDPTLESRSAGQRILLRIGQAHRRQALNWLQAFRTEIAR